MPNGCTLPDASAALFAIEVRYGPMNNVTTVVENVEFAKSYMYQPRCSRTLYSGIVKRAASLYPIAGQSHSTSARLRFDGHEIFSQCGLISNQRARFRAGEPWRDSDIRGAARRKIIRRRRTYRMRVRFRKGSIRIGAALAIGPAKTGKIRAGADARSCESNVRPVRILHPWRQSGWEFHGFGRVHHSEPGDSRGRGGEWRS